MDKYANIEGRDSFIKKFLHYTSPFLGRTLLFYVPAYLYLFACSPLEKSLPYQEEPSQETGTTNGNSTDNKYGENTLEQDISSMVGPRQGNCTLDIFTFNDDSRSRLDSYQQYTDFPVDGKIGIDSRNGNKRALLCANSHWKQWRWEDIQSYWHLGSLSFTLENEDPDYPLSAQEIRFEAGTGPDYRQVELIPFLSEIKIRSISVDFISPSYKGSSLREIKIYLTNLNGEVSLTQKNFNVCRRIINHRSLKEEECREFQHPEMIYRSIGDIQDGSTVYPDLSLYCFPNTCEEETLGSSFTRLVIEGRINGKTWFYPITINRKEETGDGGIIRNCRYLYDIVIRRSGSPDPDLPVDFGTMETRMKTEPWKRKEEYGITF